MDKTPPPLASRALAILHTAIYDAVNGMTRSHEPYLVTVKPWGEASVEAAALAAGHFVLVQLYPAQQVTFYAVYHNGLGAMDNTPTQRAGIAWGESVANAILAVRANDGSAEVVTYVLEAVRAYWAADAACVCPGPPAAVARSEALGHDQRFQVLSAWPAGSSQRLLCPWFNLTKQFGSKDSTGRTAETASGLPGLMEPAR